MTVLYDVVNDARKMDDSAIQSRRNVWINATRHQWVLVKAGNYDVKWSEICSDPGIFSSWNEGRMKRMRSSLAPICLFKAFVVAKRSEFMHLPITKHTAKIKLHHHKFSYVLRTNVVTTSHGPGQGVLSRCFSARQSTWTPTKCVQVYLHVNGNIVVDDIILSCIYSEHAISAHES